ncbi:DUF6232 family protein [Streptomyces sp. NPDC051211]|uniref:DUF6232 family protein n=1 Tax=Streptomyces sp. NPDC051211 TaxID=3154643 RepID=UPI00344DE812
MEITGTAGSSLPTPPPPPSGNTVELKISKRLLWVGEAAYPLHNITRVHTFELKPKRAEAFLSFLKWFGITSVVFVLLQMYNEETSSPYEYDDSADGIWAIGVIVFIVLLVRLVKELSAPSEYVLAVETASSSVALVTLPQPEQLRQLVLYLVNAIDNPEAEFQVRVEKLMVNPKHYHFGDTVNTYGNNNIGIIK